MNVKPGDWVHFWTNNWPTDATVIQLSRSSDGFGEPKDITGKGLYSGRGKVVRVTGRDLLVREERSNRIVELSRDDRVEPMTFDYHLLTLGDLRKFVESHRNAPDNIPVTVSLPVLFNCDDELGGYSPDDPELHEVASTSSVSACNILFKAIEQHSWVSADGFIPEDERESGEEWDFSIEIIPNGKESHDELRGEDHD